MAGKIYQGLVNPQWTVFDNKLDLFNEFMVQITCMTIVLFTEFIGEPTVEYNYGWMSVGLMILTITVNFINIFRNLFRDVRLHFYIPLKVRINKKYTDYK